MLGSRVLLETEIRSRYEELDRIVADAKRKREEAERELEEAALERRILERWEAKLVPAEAALGEEQEDNDDDDGSLGLTPTQAILEVLAQAPGLTRDEIFEEVKGRLNTRTKDKRTLVVNILRRLVTRYQRVEIKGDSYYLRASAGMVTSTPASSASDYDDFQAPRFDDDDDLPF